MKSPMWKGVKANYISVHWWINVHWERPPACELCGEKQSKKYEWANISGLYKRERSDWLNLCTSCHHKFDNSHEKLWVKLRLIYGNSGRKNAKGYSYDKKKEKIQGNDNGQWKTDRTRLF